MATISWTRSDWKRLFIGLGVVLVVGLGGGCASSSRKRPSEFTGIHDARVENPDRPKPAPEQPKPKAHPSWWQD